MERMTNLEEKLAEKTKAMDEQAANASSEITALNQTVAALTVQLHNVENDLQELRLQQMSVSANASGLDDTSMGNASSCSSSPAPFSPAPSSMEQQVDSPPTAALPLPETYATTNSVMGPFVSVPLSVLPPRSKLHWDLCEFAAQLQADSDARLPAQLAAQRLCMATVQSLWPRAQVRPYGSHVSRLVLPSSDVDLVICLPKVRRDAPADAAGVLEGRNAIKETWQQNLARKLRQEPWVVRDSVKTLPHAAVPIITLLTAPPYNVRLDISFEGPGHNGLATNDVVLSLLHEFPPLAPMMLVLKSFAIERGLAVAYSGGLSSYALLLLVARYLQEHSDTMPNGFANASRAVQHSLSTVQAGVADFGLMLMGFLDFYGNRFDPRTTARLVRQSSTEYAYQPQRQSSLKQIHGQRSAKVLSRKNSERSMSLSLSFADVVRDGGGAAVVAPKTSPLAPARPPRFSRDDLALEESINERWETKDDSELK
ncbi:hypothetical protein PF005_g10398 [Phytophthora fragariae]|uniref:Poly(A) RNA polymerase mitochondrial-like central palm domain-containing protein n=2 Tax=Phytophthora fragariae TaxID=53985 RepID=A0A6A3SEN2_9STRA|nr:hypothetical protein PF007_g10301 [Phytophthora fragariae]KAE9212937.1 hypothetical protein PF005_g10398 [Phytophthora fragariae]